MDCSEANPPLNQLICTQDCLKAMAESVDMTARERQFCLLLNRSDALSRKACEHLYAKVDIAKLIDKGYIIDCGADEEASTPQKVQSANNEVEISEDTQVIAAHNSFNNPDPKAALFGTETSQLASAAAVSSTSSQFGDEIEIDPALRFVVGDY